MKANPLPQERDEEIPPAMRDSFAELDRACTRFLREREPGFAEKCKTQRGRAKSRYKLNKAKA